MPVLERKLKANASIDINLAQLHDPGTLRHLEVCVVLQMVLDAVVDVGDLGHCILLHTCKHCEAAHMQAL